ncbi:AMP-binding protein [Roseomonas sp. BN140053]|uniref:AMP-binding protein n=1 Tax=Roseomonas sp. BN140053 TaxID=3391898 RepID=UPI0039E7C950
MSAPLPPVHPTVVHMLAEAARRHPGGEALVCGEERLNYAEYLGAVGGFARELQGRGVAGGRVALLLGNCVDLAIATFAVQAAGAQVVALNPGYTAHELEPILADAAPALVLHGPDTAAALAPIAERLGIPGTLAVGPGARRLAAVPPAPLPALPDPESPSTLQYTGGTTGRSKGVELIHRTVSLNVSQREALLPTAPGDERVLAITPLFHVYATAMCLYLAAYCRGALVILPRYHPQLVLEAIARERITLFSGSPTIFNGLMGYEGFANTDFSSLRLCFSGASALAPATLDRWEAATGARVCEGFGLSESGPVLAFNPRHGVRKPGSVGVPVPDTRIEIVDTEAGTRVLPPREPGEIRVRGPQLMRGYRNLPDQTAAALRNGWLYTGDIGWLDEDGYLHISDRKKDMAIVSGFNVFPREVEEALLLHPAVAEAAVVGTPDSYRGEALVAFVVPRPGQAVAAAPLEQHLQDRLAGYKVPRRYQALPALPKTVVGKVDKQALRQLAAGN